MGERGLWEGRGDDIKEGSAVISGEVSEADVGDVRSGAGFGAREASVVEGEEVPAVEVGADTARMEEGEGRGVPAGFGVTVDTRGEEEARVHGWKVGRLERAVKRVEPPAGEGQPRALW